MNTNRHKYKSAMLINKDLLFEFIRVYSWFKVIKVSGAIRPLHVRDVMGSYKSITWRPERESNPRPAP